MAPGTEAATVDSLVMVALCNRADHYIFACDFYLLSSFFMVALWNRADHYIFMLWFLFIFFYLFPSPNLRGRTLDVYHTCTHGVALVRI